MIGRLCAVVAFVAAVAFADECQVALDRDLTLRNRYPHQVEAEHGRMAAGEARLAFTLPRPVGAVCGEKGPPPLLAYRSDSGSEVFAADPVAGGEYRQSGEGVWAAEVGGLFYGVKGPATAHLDARIFSETGGDPARPSYDHEGTDEQEQGVTGTVDYRSYARFRGDLSLELPFGRLTAARDAAQWGPGLYANGVLSQEAAPYYQYVYATRIGPLSMTSLYGDLQVDADQNSADNLAGRDLFAHRYELALGPSLTLGISEALILFGLSKPYLFLPVFPLFIAKSLLAEGNSNGSIAFDGAWRMPFGGLVYGEFLLDDLESPSSLFLKDYMQNKWGALMGAHFVRDLAGARAGLIAEFSHMEPWVYTHFQPATAQAANLGLPIGNPYGPDSRTVIVKAYARLPRGGYAGLAAGLFWKGEGPGADLAQPTPKTPFAAKERLAGDSGPQAALEPEVAWNWNRISAGLDGRIGHGNRLRAALRIFL